MFWTVLFYTFKGYYRQSYDWVAVLAAYGLSVLLYGYSLSHKPELLIDISIYILWINMVLASFLAIPSLFSNEREEGILEQWLLMPIPLEYIMFVKLLAHWVCALLPCVAIAPIMAIALNGGQENTENLTIALALGTLIMASLNLVIGALATADGHRPALIQLLLLPIYVPVLLFGISAASQPLELSAASGGIPLIAITLICVPFSIIISAMILRKNAGFC